MSWQQDSDLLTVIPLPSPSLSALPEFIQVIEDLRNNLDKRVWRQFCLNDVALKCWIAFLRDDPYTLRALTKPRGYAGDAVLMDLAYKHKSCATTIDSASENGRAVYRIMAEVPTSVSARKRIEFISQEIERASKNGSFEIASFASGHGRELENLSANCRKNIECFYAVDSDRLSLQAMQHDYGETVRISQVPKSVFKMKVEDVPPVSLAYSLGLFDYLEIEAARRVLKKMASIVKPGGRLIVGNLSDKAGSLGYCEAVMDWWMIPRSMEEMEELKSAMPDSTMWDVRTVNVDCFNYLVADRAA